MLDVQGMAGMPGDTEPLDALENEIASLADEITELGLLAEDAFKNAAAALYGQDQTAGSIALESEQACTQGFQMIHQKALMLLTQHRPTGDELRRIVELQQTASDFSRVATDARHIAEQAVALAGMAELFLHRAGDHMPALFLQIVRQAYVEIRGCVIATTTRDTALARRLISEDGELDRLFLEFKAAVAGAILAEPRLGASLNRLVLVAVDLEDIGNRVVSICRTLLYTPPAMP
jgi:phosphate transport system protein